ncbi:hypothetical protein K799_01152, partial [Salmonella enterica subsp. enterica serovar Newport str. SHSN009]
FFFFFPSGFFFFFFFFWAHNPKVVGSNPAPATNLMNTLTGVFLYLSSGPQRQCGQHPTYPRNKLAVISG